MSAEESPVLPVYLGVDVGGTSVKIGIVDDTGRSLAHGKIATEHEKGPQDGVARILSFARGLLNEAGIVWEDIQALGLGTPGTMNVREGKLLHMPNMSGWNFFPIRNYFQEQSGKPVAFINDGNAAAYGEYWVGRGREHDSLVMVTLGTGVGGGVILQDGALHGDNSHGSECGHIIIDSSPDARVCPCGQPGHLEAYVSATSLVKRAEEQLIAGEASSLAETMEENGSFSALDIANHAEQGDPFAEAIIVETAELLGRGITSIMHIIDPGIVVLGGGVNFGGRESETGKKFLETIRKTVAELTFPVLAENTIIDFATLGSSCGYIGAAGVARKQFGQTS
ncbi:MAG: glucokinase [Planctomycetaceae bacterium]|nr:glucokinase [Planctomycetaceae bacterium]|tara:strand:+ start:159 stop:1175 length:1017 start_codon:yes stop_codon:yes gene_type:complete